MKPAELQASSFKTYPPQAQQLASAQIDLLRRLPIALLPLLLRELSSYDWKFPAERRELDAQFSYLERLSADQFSALLAPFAKLRVTDELEKTDWVNTPALFSEQLSAHLWATGQIAAFRSAATDYVAKTSPAPEPLPVPRLALVLLGKGAKATDGYMLFRKLRPQGVHFTAVDTRNVHELFADGVSARAERTPRSFGHWLIDGDTAERGPAGVTCVSYASLRGPRAKLQAKIQNSFESGTGSEAIRTNLAAMRPGEIGLADDPGTPVMSRFQLSLLTEGSGTQIFSTTFVQWAAREALRRAQPLTLYAHFAPRQREKSMREMLGEAQGAPQLDPQGSLVDADMGAYYTWLNLQRLSGAEQSRFLVCVEGGRDALLIAPGLPKNTARSEPITAKDLFARTA